MKTGLRTEIVANVVMILAAALLFAGFLLVKLAEREMLEQKRFSLQHLTTTIADSLTEMQRAAVVPRQPTLLDPPLKSLDKHPEILGWRLLDAQSRTVAGVTGSDIVFSPFPIGLSGRDVAETLVYSSSWNLFKSPTDNYLDLAVPLADVGEVRGILQLRFSLNTLSSRVHQAQRLVLVYVLLYGAVLTGFGVYLLNRNVVKPIRNLNQATGQVAAGTLEPVPVPVGPSEITRLAESFNQMISALSGSRAETETYIRSLEDSNQALQQARNDLIRSEKLATVGHLAAGMAHEIGNPLAAVIGYLNVLQMDLADGQDRDLVARSLAEAGRIDILVRELLDYAKPVPADKETFDPVEVLADATSLMAHQGVFDTIDVADSGLVSGGHVLMNRGQLLQVFVNLLLNARDVMPAGGTLTVASQSAPQGVSLSVTDQGGGIPAERLQQVFEPFFTTKDPDKGRGLGLAVCQRIIDEAGGRISARSQVGEGTTFTVWLPITMESV